MKFLFVFIVIVLLNVNGVILENNEDFYDPVLYYLLNENFTALSRLYDEEYNDGAVGGDPVFSHGVWKCGACDNITDSKLLYSEVNEVVTNIGDDNFVQVQVGLSFAEMRCVTIKSDQECDVKRVSGDCAGPTVTLAVFDSDHFLVRVFGN